MSELNISYAIVVRVALLTTRTPDRQTTCSDRPLGSPTDRPLFGSPTPNMFVVSDRPLGSPNTPNFVVSDRPKRALLGSPKFGRSRPKPEY